MVELLFYSKERVISHKLTEGQSIIIGRNLNNMNGVTLIDEGVSGTHASITFIKGSVNVCDLDSTNGTFADGKRVQAGSLASAVSEIRIGPVRVEIRRTASAHTSSSSPTKGLDELLATRSEVVIGRMTDCDITLDESTVSKRHARIFKKDGVVYVEDLGSTNGTYKNRQRIKGRTTLGPNDVLNIGLTSFQLGREIKRYGNESAITVENLEKIFPDGNIGLHPCSFDVPKGSFVAMMGPSGCGKSTLLKTLNGDSPASAGLVKIFGRELSENYDLLKQQIGYVPQDDIVHRELTVDKTLYYAAKLRLGPNATEEFIHQRMDFVLNSLNINDPAIRKNRVEKLSGGQRKRVSIAVELLNDPSILLLDEPTSPLDPETIAEFLKCLQKLCQNGTTVIMVTHKPEDLKYADIMVFLGAGGYHVYFGDVSNYKTYFGESEILEIYSKLSKKEQSSVWYRKWNQNKPPATRVKQNPIKHNEGVDFFHQLYWLTVRYLMVKTSNCKNMVIIFGQPVLIATLLMLVYAQIIDQIDVPINPTMDPNAVPPDASVAESETIKTGNSAVIFLMAVAAIWFGVSNSAKEIVSETAIYRRERMFNLKVRSYLLSKWTILMSISFLQLVIFLTLLKGRFGDDLVAIPETLGFLMLLSSGSILFGLFLSSKLKTTDEVMSVLPVALMPQIILSGVLSKLENPLTELLSYFTFGRWGTEGIARIQDAAMDEPVYLIESDNPSVAAKSLYQSLYGDDNMIAMFKGLQENMIAIAILSIIFLSAIVVLLLNFDRRFERAQSKKANAIKLKFKICN